MSATCFSSCPWTHTSSCSHVWSGPHDPFGQWPCTVPMMFSCRVILVWVESASSYELSLDLLSIIYMPSVALTSWVASSGQLLVPGFHLPPQRWVELQGLCPWCCSCLVLSFAAWALALIYYKIERLSPPLGGLLCQYIWKQIIKKLLINLTLPY